MCEERLQLHMSMHVMLQMKTLRILVLGIWRIFVSSYCEMETSATDGYGCRSHPPIQLR